MDFREEFAGFAKPPKIDLACPHPWLSLTLGRYGYYSYPEGSSFAKIFRQNGNLISRFPPKFGPDLGNVSGVWGFKRTHRIGSQVPNGPKKMERERGAHGSIIHGLNGRSLPLVLKFNSMRQNFHAHRLFPYSVHFTDFFLGLQIRKRVWNGRLMFGRGGGALCL